MRRILFAGACLLAMTGYANAQVEVHDTSNVLEWAQGLFAEAKAYVLQVKQEIDADLADEYAALAWAKQQEQYVVEVQQALTLATQLEAFVHNPTLGAAMTLLNAAGLGNTLPISPYAVTGLVNSFAYPGPNGLPNFQGILSSLNAFTSTAYTKNHVYSPPDDAWESQQLVANGNNIAGTQGTFSAAYSDLRAHDAGLQALRDRLATASTPKDVQDIQAQIELEQVWTQNQTGEIAAIKGSADTQQDSVDQRDNEAWRQSSDQFIARANALPWN